MTPKPFDLWRSFALLSLLCIAVICSLSVWALYGFLTNHMLERDAIVTMEFVQSIADLEEENVDFSRPELLRDEEGLGEFFAHVANMMYVVRAVVYSKEGEIVWSSDKDVVGRRFDDNPTLQTALGGELAYERVVREKSTKQEHEFLPESLTEFVETYVPIRNRARTEVVGVAEIYRTPGFLLDSIRQGMWGIWISATVSGLLIYVTLLWIVRRASLIVNAQHEQLVEAELMSAVGAMAAAMAHGIHNPLASIRSSAELALDDQASAFDKELAEGIVDDADRLEQWVRKLILLARPEQDELDSACLATAVRSTLETFAPAMKAKGVVLALDVEEPLPPVKGNSMVIEQVLHNLISNALDAMPEGGTLTVQARAANSRDHVEVKVIDTGEGMSEERLQQIFKPFVTSKQTGFGLGLPLVRRLVERLGGTIALTSRKGSGTTAALRLPSKAG